MPHGVVVVLRNACRSLELPPFHFKFGYSEGNKFSRWLGNRSQPSRQSIIDRHQSSTAFLGNLARNADHAVNKPNRRPVQAVQFVLAESREQSDGHGWQHRFVGMRSEEHTSEL